MTTKPKLITADELLLLPDDGYEYELVRGVLTEQMPPPGKEHGVAAMGFGAALYPESTDGHGLRE